MNCKPNPFWRERELHACSAQILSSHYAAGPMELVVLRAPTDDSRGRALAGGLSSGLVAGCEAAVLVRVKPQLVFKNIWQVGTRCEALQPRGRRDGPWAYAGSNPCPPRKWAHQLPWVMQLSILPGVRVCGIHSCHVHLGFSFLLCTLPCSSLAAFTHHAVPFLLRRPAIVSASAPVLSAPLCFAPTSHALAR